MTERRLCITSFVRNVVWPSVVVLNVVLVFVSPARAATYWVSPTGSAAWSACQSETPLSGAAACSFAAANTNAAAGDTVYYRGGAYYVNGVTAIVPRNTGTSPSAKIVFSAFTGEAPVFEQGTSVSTGIDINGKSWIKITGLSFHDMIGTSMIRGDAHFNEVSYCSFTNTVNTQIASRIFVLGDNGAAPWSTHNWFHHNYLSRRANSHPCNEGVDLLRIGMAVDNEHDDYNTVESNYLEYSGHANVVTYGKHLVIRGNIAHNEPWITGCEVYNGTEVDLYGAANGSTSSTSLAISSGSETLTIATGLPTSLPGHWYAGYPVSIASNADMTNTMSGTITSYNSTTGELVVSIARTTGSGTYADWDVSTKNIPYYVNPAYDGKYSHRVMCIGDNDLAIDHSDLVEGNRLGYGGINPNNNGPTDLAIQSRRNIVRFNFTYGAMGNGIDFKSAVGNPTYRGGVLNHVYNNTTYSNGVGYDYSLYSGLNTAWPGQGIGQAASGGEVGAHTDNVIKNNIAYGNGRGDICFTKTPQFPNCAPWSGDTVEHNWTTYDVGQGGYGDPLFVNPTLSDTLSQNLIPSAHGYTATPIPDLRLQASSPAIDGGKNLTAAVGAGHNSTSLVVADAGYFQDGTWGSDLARGVTLFPDWIAIGAVTHVVKIASIDYTHNTITLASPMSWSDGDKIWLYRKSDGAIVLVGAAPDLGADEYGAEGATPLPPPKNPVEVTPPFAPKVYPDPWRSDKHAAHPTITFAGLTLGTTIKIFTTSGHLVKGLHTEGPSIAWDLTNDSGDKVASGVYLYVITDGQGDKVKGKVAVIK